MKALTCDMCGSTNIIKQDGVFVCQSCGTKYAVEEAKRMMTEGTVEVTGTVTIDSSSELANLYELARRAKETENSENASKYFEQILVKDPHSWEANFYSVYFNAMNSNIDDIPKAVTKVSNCLMSVFELIKANTTDPAAQYRIVDEITDKIIAFGNKLKDMSISNYRNCSKPGETEENEVVTTKMAHNLVALAGIGFGLGDKIANAFDEATYNDIIVKAWKYGVLLTADDNVEHIYTLAKGAFRTPQKELADSYISKIGEVSPEIEIEDKPSNPVVERIVTIVLTIIIGLIIYWWQTVKQKYNLE